MGVHISRIQSLELDKLGTSELLVSSDLSLGMTAVINNTWLWTVLFAEYKELQFLNLVNLHGYLKCKFVVCNVDYFFFLSKELMNHTFV